MNQDNIESQVNQTESSYDFDMNGGSGIYELEWESLGIHIKVNRIRENSSHEIRAGVEVTSNRPNGGHLNGGRVILTSPGNMESFEKLLKKEDSSIEWGTVVKQMSAAVIKDYQRGIPEEALMGTEDRAEATRWIIEPLVMAGQPSLLYGTGSTGKSFLGQYFAVLVSEGVNDNGFHIEEPLTTLYLDWETDKRELDYRVGMIRNGLHLDPVTEPNLWYKTMTQSLSADIEQVREIVLKRGIKFAVLDSMGSASGGEPESAEVMLRMFNALRSLRIPTLNIHHVNKENILFGSVYAFNSARVVIEARKSQNEGEDRIDLGLWSKKANNARMFSPIGFTIGFDGNMVTFRKKEVRDTRLVKELSVVDQMKKLLDGEPMSKKDLAEAVEKSEKHVATELNRNKDKFVEIRKGVYVTPTYVYNKRQENPNV